MKLTFDHRNRPVIDDVELADKFEELLAASGRTRSDVCVNSGLSHPMLNKWIKLNGTRYRPSLRSCLIAIEELGYEIEIKKRRG